MTWTLDSAERLAALREVDTFPGVPDEEFDRYTRLASRLLGAPTTLVSLVTDDRQYFPSSLGLGEPWATRGETPLELSFCKHVVMTDAELVVTDAVNDPRVCDNGAIDELGVRAYLGVPLRAPGGEPLGSMCAIAHAPREWTDDDIATLRDIAAAASAAIALRVSEHRRALEATEASHNLRTPLAALRLELEDLALEVAQRREETQGLQIAVSHVDELNGILDRLLANSQYRALRVGEVNLRTVAESVASRRRAVGLSGYDVVVEGDDVRVTSSLSGLRYALDALVERAERVATGTITLRVTGNGAGRVQVAGAFAEPVGDAPIPDALVKQLGARLAVDPAPAVAYELALPIAP